MENSERLLDDDFKDVEKLVKNQKEIEELRKRNSDQENHIKLLEKKVAESESLLEEQVRKLIGRESC